MSGGSSIQPKHCWMWKISILLLRCKVKRPSGPLPAVIRMTAKTMRKSLCVPATDDVTENLREELGKRLAIAGVEVLEARISHLAYAPEIAQSMLRRQQAQAVIAARKQIVEGAMSMVEMTLSHLEKQGVVQLDEEESGHGQ